MTGLWFELRSYHCWRNYCNHTAMRTDGLSDNQRTNLCSFTQKACHVPEEHPHSKALNKPVNSETSTAAWKLASTGSTSVWWASGWGSTTLQIHWDSQAGSCSVEYVLDIISVNGSIKSIKQTTVCQASWVMATKQLPTQMDQPQTVVLWWSLPEATWNLQILSESRRE